MIQQIRELWRRLAGVFFRSQPAPPPSQPEEKSIPVNIGEGVLSPPPREDGEVEIPATVQGEQPLISTEENKESGISSPISESDALPVKEHSKWEIRPCKPREFDKVGRLYLDGEDMVIRSDLDNRGFRVSLVDVEAVLNRDPQDIRLLKTGKKVGTVQLSTSGRAMNFTIAPFFYTTPLQSVVRMLAGEQRKAPLFVGREQAEGG